MAVASDPDDPTRYSCQNVHAAGYFPVEGTIVDLMHADEERMAAAAPRAAIDEGTFQDWDFGFDFYACQSLVDERGRTLLVGWMSLPHDKYDVRAYDNPTDTWRGCLTVPRVLTLADDGRILQAPPAEIDALRGEAVPFEATEAGAAATMPKLADFELTLKGNGTLRFDDALELRIADGVAELVFTDDEVGQGRKVRRTLCGDVCRARVLVDTSVLEIFLDDGRTVFGTRYYSEADDIRVTAEFASASGVWYPMDPITINYVVDR
jgi:beta-fructofuranosidase